MDWKDYLAPDKRKILIFLFTVLILLLRGIHWMLPDTFLIQIPILIISAVILIPAGILFYLASWIIPAQDDVVPFPNDVLLLIYPFLIIYSYLVSCLFARYSMRKEV